MFCFFRLPPEFLPVSGQTERWCASALGTALLFSSRAGSWFGACIQTGLRALSITIYAIAVTNQQMALLVFFATQHHLSKAIAILELLQYSSTLGVPDSIYTWFDIVSDKCQATIIHLQKFNLVINDVPKCVKSIEKQFTTSFSIVSHICTANFKSSRISFEYRWAFYQICLTNTIETR